jgi:hypothetical protein
VLCPHTDRAHPGVARTLDAGRRILYDDAAIGRRPHPLRGQEEDLRVRFAALHILSGDHRAEVFGQTQYLDHRCGVGARRRGRERLPPAGGAQPLEPEFGAGQQLDPALSHQGAIARLLVVGDALDFGAGRIRAEHGAQNPIVALPEGRNQEVPIEAMPRGSQRLAPR